MPGSGTPDRGPVCQSGWLPPRLTFEYWWLPDPGAGMGMTAAKGTAELRPKVVLDLFPVLLALIPGAMRQFNHQLWTDSQVQVEEGGGAPSE